MWTHYFHKGSVRMCSFFILSTVYHGYLGRSEIKVTVTVCRCYKCGDLNNMFLIVEMQAKHQKPTLIFDSNIASNEEDAYLPID